MSRGVVRFELTSLLASISDLLPNQLSVTQNLVLQLACLLGYKSLQHLFLEHVIRMKESSLDNPLRPVVSGSRTGPRPSS